MMMNATQELNTRARYPMVSIHDRLSGRQANNLLDYRLSDSVRPWFSGMQQEGVDRALAALDHPEQRDSAAAFLGLEIVPVS